MIRRPRPGAGPVRGALAGHDVILVENPDYADGLSTSLARGLAALPREVDGAIVCQKVSEGKRNFGYNALTDEYGDLVKMGVIVPLKVERVALQNAASVASLLLTTDALVSEIKEKDDDKKKGGGMPGM